MNGLTPYAVNEAWWQAACVAVRATVTNATERDNALYLLSIARDKANEVFNASHDRNTNAAQTGASA